MDPGSLLHIRPGFSGGISHLHGIAADGRWGCLRIPSKEMLFFPMKSLLRGNSLCGKTCTVCGLVVKKFLILINH
jgi:hypothetical protein